MGKRITLVEILVVMAVLVILVSAMVLVIFRIPYADPAKITKGLLDKIAQGIEQYKFVYRMYPPQGTLVDSTKPSQVEASSGALWQEIEYYNHFADIGAAYKYKGGTFTDPKTGTVQTWYCYQDAWQQPLRYLCFSPYTQYTLTSGGPDLILDTPDDICAGKGWLERNGLQLFVISAVCVAGGALLGYWAWKLPKRDIRGTHREDE